jgi:hypothetical protein
MRKIRFCLRGRKKLAELLLVRWWHLFTADNLRPADVSQTAQGGSDSAKTGQLLALRSHRLGAAVVQRLVEALAEALEMVLSDIQSGHAPADHLQLLVQGHRIFQGIKCGLKEGGSSPFLMILLIKVSIFYSIFYFIFYLN